MRYKNTMTFQIKKNWWCRTGFLDYSPYFIASVFTEVIKEFIKTMCFKFAEMLLVLAEHGGQGPMNGGRIIEQGAGDRGPNKSDSLWLHKFNWVGFFYLWAKIQTAWFPLNQNYLEKFRNSRSQVLYKKAVPKNFTNFRRNYYLSDNYLSNYWRG